MKRLLTVIGARPQIIKAAALSRCIAGQFADRIDESILHTGQHYDANMSQVFFDELGIPAPDFNLGVGSGRHGEQTAKMVAGIEDVLMGRMPSANGACHDDWDGIVLYGDTNSTLAGAVAASKLHVPIFHIEAGLRSFNMTMPEEINRIVCDQLSSVLFTPTATATANLRREGFFERTVKFARGAGQKIVESGDIMYDNSLYFSELAEKGEAAGILARIGCERGQYILATVHRDNNTDRPERLTAIFRALLDVSEELGLKVVLPLHPRTSHLLESKLDPEFFAKANASERLVVVPPASFLEMVVLEKNCAMVMTDSGGVQKEAFFFRRPCVIMRPETEWVEIVEHGAGILADADYQRIVDAARDLSGREVQFPPLFGDGRAASHICDGILNYLDS